MTDQTKNNIVITLLALLVVVLTNTITCLVWQHECVVHRAAFFEADNWARVSFHWEDTSSYARSPFKDYSECKKASEEQFAQTLKDNGIKE